MPFIQYSCLIPIQLLLCTFSCCRPWDEHWLATSFSLSTFLAAKTNLAPFLANASAVAAPIPELAPDVEPIHVYVTKGCRNGLCRSPEQTFITITTLCNFIIWYYTFVQEENLRAVHTQLSFICGLQNI